MQLAEAQRDVREVYLAGLPGLSISALVWFASAALGTWRSWSAAMWMLVVGGALIFVALEALVRVMHRNPALDGNNPLNPLMLQTTFLLPLLLPLIAATFQWRPDWLYPAFMIALAAHFLPFMFLFGMWHFGALGMVLFASALVFGFSGAEHFTVAGWYGGVVQLLFGFVGYEQLRRERDGARG